MKTSESTREYYNDENGYDYDRANKYNGDPQDELENPDHDNIRRSRLKSTSNMGEDVYRRRALQRSNEYKEYFGDDYHNAGQQYNRETGVRSGGWDYIGKAANYGSRRQRRNPAEPEEIGRGRSGENYSEGDYGDGTAYPERGGNRNAGQSSREGGRQRRTGKNKRS
jgi:hypothetical protein